MKAALIALSLLATPVLAQSTAKPDRWTPTPDMIAKLEAQVHVPAGAGDFHTAARFYWGSYDHGRKAIVGDYSMRTGPGGITIVNADERAPIVMDGGCRYVMVWYDVDADRVSQVACHGVA